MRKKSKFPVSYIIYFFLLLSFFLWRFAFGDVFLFGWINTFYEKQEYIWMSFKNEPNTEEKEETCLKNHSQDKIKDFCHQKKYSFSWAHHDPDYVTTTLKASIWTKSITKSKITTTNREQKKTSPWITTTKEEPDLFMFFAKNLNIFHVFFFVC